MFANVIHLVITAKWSHTRVTYLIYTPGKQYCNSKFETEYILLDGQFQYIFYT